MSGGTAGDGKDAKDADGRDGVAQGAIGPEPAFKGSLAPGATGPGQAVGAEASEAERLDPAEAGATAAATGGPARQSEWTASDHRGPLRAPTEGDRVADEAAPGGEGLGDAPPSAESPAVSPAAPARRSPLPLVAGIVVGSLIGAGSAAVVYNLQQGGSPSGSQLAAKIGDLSTRVDALEKRPDGQAAIGDVRNEVHGLAGRVAALEKRPAAPPQAQPSQGAPASSPPAPQPQAARQPPAEAKPAVQAAAQAPSAPSAAPAASPASGGDLAGKVAALQAALDAAGKQDSARQAAIKDLGGKLDALQGSLSKVQEATRSNADAAKGQRQDVDGKLAALQGAVSAAQKQAGAVQGDLSALQGSVASVQGEQKALAGKVGAPALAVAADSLVAQIESGKPYRSQVDALAALGADPARVAVLRENSGAGVLSAQALAASFAPLADPVVATGNKVPAGAGLGEQLKHGLFGLVSVHRADDTGGDGLASRVALLQADLAHNDVAGAYAVWTALPADARAKATAFGAQLKSSAEALAAARGLQAQAIDGLAANPPAANAPAADPAAAKKS